MERGDLEAVLDTFAPDAVLRSPLTSRLVFSGHEQIEAVMGVVTDVFEDLRYTDQLVSGDRAVLVATARVEREGARDGRPPAPGRAAGRSAS